MPVLSKSPFKQRVVHPVLAVVLTTALTGVLAAAPVRLTVPFTVDRTMTASGMAVEMEAGDVGGLSLTEAAKNAAHPQVRALETLVGHFSAKQPDAAVAMMRQGAFQSPEDALTYARNFSEAFQGAWSSVTVSRIYNTGQESWVSWQVPQGAGKVSRISRFMEEGGQWKWSDELLPTPLRVMQTLVSASEQLAVENQPGVQAVAAMDFKHRVKVPGMEAAWLFNGFSSSWDAFGNGPVPDHPVTLAYAKAVKALQAGDLETFANAHLPFSAQRMKDSVGAMDDGQKASFMDTVRKLGRQVTFVLEASPVFLVFYETSGRGLQYDTLFAPGGDLSQLKFCNFFVESFIDEIMKEPGFFHDPVIRPLAGRLEDPPKTAAVAVPAAPAVPAPANPEAGPAPVPAPAPAPAPAAPAGNPGDATSPFSGWGLLLLLILLGLLVVLVLRFFRPKS